VTVQSSRAAEKHPHAAGEEVGDEPAMLKSSGRGAPIIPDPQSRSPAVRFVMAAGASFVALLVHLNFNSALDDGNLSKFGFVARLFVVRKQLQKRVESDVNTVDVLDGCSAEGADRQGAVLASFGRAQARHLHPPPRARDSRRPPPLPPSPGHARVRPSAHYTRLRGNG
jgi:hypothetical protein